MAPMISFSRRVRETPYEARVMAQGARAFTVYNQMTLATFFRSPEEDYWHLREHVQLWDVACERQVEVRGPDALRLVELSTPRDLSACRIGQCVYAPLCDETGGIVNDPVVLRLAEDRFWISIADSGVLLWLKGLAIGRGLDVEVFEPDVNICALQGPKAERVLQPLVEADLRTIRFFRFFETRIAGAPVANRAIRLERTGRLRDLPPGFEQGARALGRDLGVGRSAPDPGRLPQPDRAHRDRPALLRQRHDARQQHLRVRARSIRDARQGSGVPLPARARSHRAEKASPRSSRRSRSKADRRRRCARPGRCSPRAGKRATSPAPRGRRASRRVVAFAMVDIEHTEVGSRLSVLAEGESGARPATVVAGWER